MIRCSLQHIYIGLP